MRIRYPKSVSLSLLFYIAYSLYLFTAILTTSFFSKYIVGGKYKMVLMCCLILLILKETFCCRFNKKRIAGGAVCVFLLLIIYNVVTITPLLIMMCLLGFVYVGRNEKFETIAKLTIVVTSFTMILIIASAHFGIIYNIVGGSNGRIRDYLGFRYVLFSPAYMFNVTSLTVYVFKYDIKWKTILVLILANIWIYSKTMSRLSFITSVIVLLFACIMKIKPDFLKKKKISCHFLVFSFIIFAILSFIITLSYSPDKKFMVQLNEIMGERLYLAQTSLKKYGISWFGENIQWVGWGFDPNGKRTTTLNEYLYVDCLYIQVIQHYGIIFFTIFLTVFTATSYKVFKSKDYYMLILLSTVAMRSIFDDLSLSLHYNTFWFTAGIYLVGSPKKVYHSIRLKRKKRKIGIDIS